MTKGQAGVEFITIVTIGIMLIIPVSLLFQSYASQTTTEVVDQQIVLVGSNMLSKAEEMYGLGQNSFTTMNIRLPDNVVNVTIANTSELAFKYDGPQGPSDIVLFSQRVEITNGDYSDCQDVCSLNLSAGENRLRIRSSQTSVSMQIING